MKLAREFVLARLHELSELDKSRRLFGAMLHQYVLHPPLASATLDAFERKYAVVLPHDYRYFLTEIGNGGAGPYYGVFPFGQHDDSSGERLEAWSEFLVGDIGQPFEHRDAWNIEPADAAEEGPDSDEQEVLLDEFERQYFEPSIMNGAIPICHKGCALRLWLVVNGEQAGYVWADDRADGNGIHPLKDADGRQLSFETWYLDWLGNLKEEARVKGMGSA